jgi:prepilin-type processing-associated H-X9-DG protein
MTLLPPDEPGEQVFELPSQPKTCGLAIASLVCAIVGFCIPVVGGILAVVLGAVAISKINKSAGAIGGKGLAVAGLVVGAISILLLPLMVALLLPAMMGAREMAYNAQSQANVKQLGAATMGYAAEQDGQLPPPDSWPQELKRYLGAADKVLANPSDEEGGRAYAMNAKLAERFHRLHLVEQTGRTVLFFECAPGSSPGGGPENLPPKPRHAGKYVIGFCDGHVEAVEPEKVNQLIWDPQAAPPGS